MKIDVLLFATLKERAGSGRLTLELAVPATVRDLKSALAGASPRLAEHLPTALVSVNREFAFPDDLIHEGDEVALFPPVSGGSSISDGGRQTADGSPPAQASGADVSSALRLLDQTDPSTQTNSTTQTNPTIFLITNEVLDLTKLVESITRPTTGAVCVFTGMVRGVTARGKAHDTTYLEYEAYKPMAEAKMQQVADEIRGQWPMVEGIAIVQRIGRLKPGTPTVLIACSAAHRDTGVFEAARYGIDRLKEIVPIWKKEIGPDGEEWVEGEFIPAPSDREA